MSLSEVVVSNLSCIVQGIITFEVKWIECNIDLEGKWPWHIDTLDCECGIFYENTWHFCRCYDLKKRLFANEEA